jgi:acetyl-CoA carboxylase beta subunit
MNTSVQKIQMLKCPACGEMTLHPKRKEMGYHVCINCSTAKPVVGITTVEGSGDHTYNDIIIMDQDRAQQIAIKEAELKGGPVHLEVLDFDTDDSAVSQSVKEAVTNALDDEETPYNTFDPNEEKQGIEGIDY